MNKLNNKNLFVNSEKEFFPLVDMKSDFRNRNLYLLILSKLQQRKTLLDIGCGAGHFLYLAYKKGLRAEGIEPCSRLVSSTKTLYGSKIKVYNIFAENIGVVTGKKDYITMLDSLEHIDNDVSVLKKVRNKLNKGGKFIVLVPAYQFLYGQRDKRSGHYRRYYKKDIINKLKSGGYTKIKTRLGIYILNKWFYYIENNINFGFGLSLIIEAK